MDLGVGMMLKGTFLFLHIFQLSMLHFFSIDVGCGQKHQAGKNTIIQMVIYGE